MGGDGDGWVRCSRGHRHWGRFGAAGLLLTVPGRAVLQHRAHWTHEGGTWGLPGGARDSHEDVVATALREAQEEAAIDPGAVVPLGWRVDDHGGWSYTTVVGNPRQAVAPRAANPESTEVRWWAIDDVGTLPLHHGLAASWPQLQRPPRRLAIVVDAANVVGARPDGWWHDRLGAARRLRSRIGRLTRCGIFAASLPRNVSVGGLTGLLPSVVLVVEGEARRLAEEPAGPSWWDAAVAVRPAERDGDTTVAGEAASWQQAGAQAVVVTADRGLRERLVPGLHVEGPSWLLDLVDAASGH